MEKEVNAAVKTLKDRYFIDHDVLFLSEDLLGKRLMTCIDGVVTGGIIIETEGYRAPEDQASHAFKNRRTKRNEAMFLSGGRTYTYLCYGIHTLFNIVTGQHNVPHAILIRAIAPTVGIETMLKRRFLSEGAYNIASGPGLVSQALGITLQHTNQLLHENFIWVEDVGYNPPRDDIIRSPRVGVDYAGEWASKPWRFRIKYDS